MVCSMPKPSQSFFVKEYWTKNEKSFLTALSMPINDPTMSIRMHANELKVHKKTEDSN